MNYIKIYSNRRAKMSLAKNLIKIESYLNRFEKTLASNQKKISRKKYEKMRNSIIRRLDELEDDNGNTKSDADTKEVDELYKELDKFEHIYTFKKPAVKKPESFKDDNGNECTVKFFRTPEAAQKALASLKNCWYCVDCKDCKNCTNCWYCVNCKDCKNCTNCKDCRYCKNCTNCKDCKDCKDCENCLDCTDCTDCKNEHDLHYS